MMINIAPRIVRMDSTLDDSFGIFYFIYDRNNVNNQVY